MEFEYSFPLKDDGNEKNRSHSGLSKELRVGTPHQAVKSLLEIKPEIFKISPDEFYTVALNGMVQCGEA